MRKRRYGIGRYRSEPLGPAADSDKLGMWEHPSETGSPPEADEREVLEPEDAFDPGPPHEKEPAKERVAGAERLQDNPEPGFFRQFFWSVYVGSLITFSAVVFFSIGYGWPFLQDHIEGLPGIELVNDYRPNLGSQLLDRSGQKVAEFFEERRLNLVSYEELPERLIQALIATEDQQFFKHNGINPWGIARSAYENFTTGSLKGGSTISQQLAKDLYTNKERTYRRKVQEALYTIRVEQELSKEEILSTYLNQVEFGHSTKGILSAAEYYFGKRPSELNLAECATLVGLLKAVTRYSPIMNPTRSKERRAVVLQLMEDMGFITEEERKQAAEEELVLRSRSTKGAPQLDRFPYWTSFVRNNLLLGIGTSGKPPLTSDYAAVDKESVYTKGLKVETTLDYTMQEWGTEVLRKALVEQEQLRRKYRPGWGLADENKPKFASTIRPRAKLVGMITGFEEPHWLTVQLVDVAGKPVVAVKHPGKGDWREEFGVLTAKYYVQVRALDRPSSKEGGKKTVPEQDLVNRGLVSKQEHRFVLLDPFTDQHAEAALVCLEVGTGRILTWVGGYDWYSEPAKSRRNRVIEPVQPGSSFKPLIYTAAFENGYSPSTKVSNEPLTIHLPNGKNWSPKNYTGEYGGHYQLRKALIKSLNIPTVRIFETLVGRVYQHDPYYGRQSLEIAKRMGIKAYVPKELSVSLGTASITPLEMATAYSVLANNGTLVEPYAIEWIESRDGDRLYMHLPSGKENVIDPVHSFLITDILTGVIREPAGTAYRLAHDFPFPIAGKTGTTNEYFDAWFVGYSKNLVAAVWIGHDRWTSLGGKRSGGRVALPPWLEFMGKAIPYHLETHLGVSKEEIAGASGRATLARNPLGFEKPEGGLREIEVCAYSLLKPNAYCKTTTIWVKEGDEPRGVCRDCGIEYVDAPIAEPRQLYPSQAPSMSRAQPRRPVRRLEPLAIEPSDPPPSGPNVEIQNTRGLDLRTPYLPWADNPQVAPAVPRPLPTPRPIQRP